ncbi:MAG: hydroxyphenylacetyl-CoA thioesterase PaaI [Pseudomonadota bacterium]
MTPQERARQSADAMWAGDAASQAMGFRLVSVGPGTAEMSFEVRPDQLNGHGICHGGFIFALADSAFAFACNSYNALCVAQHNTISYLSPAEAGETLTARAVELSRAGRSGLYDVTVTAGDGRLVAAFRGASRQIKGLHFDEAAAAE